MKTNPGILRFGSLFLPGIPFIRLLAITTLLSRAALAVATEDLDAILKNATDGTKTPAISVLVIRDGQIASAGGPWRTPQ